MIDDIVEMVLKEARGRKGTIAASKIYTVKEEVDKVNWIIVNHMLAERRKKEDENKG